MCGLTLSLFGTPSLVRDGVPLQLHSRKCMALLAYVAVTGSSHSREALTALLWPEMDEGRARAALRSTLSRLRNALDGRWIEADWETIWLKSSPDVKVDVASFRSLLAQCKGHGHAADETCDHCLPLLSEAVDLYRDGFLTGFTLRGSTQFDDWQSIETQALRREMIAALKRLTERCTAQGTLDRAIQYARRWVGLSPLDEVAHRFLMRLYAGSGQQAKALLHYGEAERALSDGLGVPPGDLTRELYQSIKSGETPQLPVAAAIRSNLPTPSTPFVGREEELEQIAQLLAEPSCRLLSVVGPGGIGKTRLAVQVTQDRVSRLAYPACFVPLVSLGSWAQLPAEILEALDVPLSEGLPPKEQLFAVLRDRQLLLILDNLEHLLEGSGLLAEMLQAAPDITLLVTSRERLGLRDEWLFPLGGMSYPDQDEISEARQAESRAAWPGAAPQPLLASLGGYSAVELFAQCARRVRPDFSLATAGVSWVARICRLVQGMPLAIELAAPWVRAMPCREIARQIEGGLELLATTLRDMPPRHRSMRAVFDQSWGLLPAQERDVLKRLSVFRGGFRREAATEAVGAPGDLLVSLLDRSWLRVLPSGRYEMHELVRQYCGERLDLEGLVGGQAGSMEARDAHSRYFAGFLQERERDLFGSRQAEAFAEILEDMANVWATWRWAVERGDVASIGKLVISLEEVAELQGWHLAAYEAFDRAAVRLRDQLSDSGATPADTAAREIRVVLAEILRSQALESVKLGSPEKARTLCEESLQLLRYAGKGQRQEKARASATSFLGLVLWSLGDPDRGHDHAQKALALYEEAGFSRGIIAAHGITLAAHSHHLGHYEEAEEHLQTAIALARDVGDHRYHAWCLSNLSEVLCDMGEYDRARAAIEESFQVRRDLGDRAGMVDSHLRRGAIAGELGKHDLASSHYRESLATAEEHGDPNHKHAACLGLGWIAFAQGRHSEALKWFETAHAAVSHPPEERMIHTLLGLGYASCGLEQFKRSRQRLRQALSTAAASRRNLEALDALVGLAHLAASEGDPQQAAALLGFVLQHPVTRQVTRDRAQRLLTKVKAELSPEATCAALTRVQAWDLEGVVTEILQAND